MTTPLIPSELPLIPLPPPQVLYPHLRATIPLSPIQLGLVLDAVSSNLQGKGGNGERRMIGVVPVLDGDRRVGRWGCAARIKGVEKSSDDADIYNLIVEGLCRIRLPRSLPPVLSLLPSIPPPSSPFSLPIPSLSYPTTDILPYALRLLPSTLHSRVNTVPPSLLADLLVTVLEVEWVTKVELLGVPDPEDRCARVKDILIDLINSRGLEMPNDSDLDGDKKRGTGLTKPIMTSTALIPRPKKLPLIPAKQSLNEMSKIPEDLRPLYTLHRNRSDILTIAASKTVTRELTRLSKIPPQSAEYGVAKTYLEWLLALPWKNVSEDGKLIDLDKARKMLDDDHEGLEGVKRRVVEYLAVYRLKKQLFLEDQERKQKAITPSTANPSKQQAHNRLDPEIEKNLISLVPASERESLGLRRFDSEPAAGDEPGTEADDDGPPIDVFRDKGPILLLLGPPGVDKTSIARSLASSLGRKFHRISLGGVRDEAEIRGHRRTYVGALPGLLVQAMRKVGVSNPLILLDELDKVGHSSFHGDPSAALLEALDPAQNWNFHDHYLGDVPIDLSQVLFIATANSTEDMSWPLLDRCEVIHCSGYITPEKLKIARRFLLPKQIKECGLTDELVGVDDTVLSKVITDYTREAGVRSLERELGKLCRTKAVEYSAARDGQAEEADIGKYNPTISLEDAEKILGIPKYINRRPEGPVRPGVVNGLSYNGSGNGGVLVIETLLVPGGHGKLVMTGRLGDVFRESIELCLTWVKSRAMSLGITSSPDQAPLKDIDVHYHIPEGAVSKDGPSAGIATVLAFISLLTGKEVDPELAVTGEMSLRGTILRIGGVKEKVIGAHRAGIKRIILPLTNKGDVIADIPEQVKVDIKFVFVEKIEQAIEEVWGKGIWAEGMSRGGGTGRGVGHARIDARL